MREGFAAVLTVAAIVAPPAMAAGVLETHGGGVQVYSCVQTEGRFAWALTGPDATLMSADGRVIIKHFAGPTWQGADGSAVQGEVVAMSAAEQPGSVPWLVLKGRAPVGAGLLSSVAYVIRSHTMGGAAPASGCDAAHDGGETRVPYTATYTFFGVN